MRLHDHTMSTFSDQGLRRLCVVEIYHMEQFQGYLALWEEKLPERAENRRVTAASNKCQVFWPVGIQQAF